MKYIIKNCDIGFKDLEDNLICPYGCKRTGFTNYCKEVTDCLLKQIVEKCKNAQKTQWVNNKKKPYSPSKAAFARDILKGLEIEEVNETLSHNS